MRLLLLGEPAGGEPPGWPPAQWTVAISEDGVHWALVNASPDIGAQMRRSAAIQRSHRRRLALQSVVLLDAQLQHVAGLLALRHGPPLHVHATPAVFEHLNERLPILPALQAECGVGWHLLAVAGDCHAASFRVEGFERTRFTALAVDAAQAGPQGGTHCSTHDGPHADAHAAVGQRVALLVENLVSGRSALLATAADLRATARRVDEPAAPDAALTTWGRRADCVLIDVSAQPLDGTPGYPSAHSLTACRGAGRTVLLGMQRAQPPGAGNPPIEMAHDGMEIDL
jgi:pyrroloquinoline quinone biosynthesis protein B